MRKLVLAAASIAALTLIGPASAQSPVIIKFSHVVASDTPKGKAAEKFKELAEKYTDGKVKVEIYPNSTLYKDKEELEALQLGAVQMLAPSNSKFGPIGIKEFEVFDLPYILPDLATLRKVTDGPLGARLLKLLDSKGMTGLAYWDNGFKEMSANKKLISPVDYKGVKLDCGYRIDLLVNDEVILELKAIEKILPVHEAQLLSYLRLLNKRVGLLINFCVPVLKEGIVRRVL